MKRLVVIFILCMFLVQNLFFSSFTNTVAAADARIVNPRVMYTYAMLMEDLMLLESKYPNLIHTEIIGKSEYNRDIYAVSLGKGPAISFINGSVHAREWISTNINMAMIEDYAIAYQTDTTIGGLQAREILDKSTICFVPMVNPDGVELQQFGLSKFPESAHKSLIAMNEGSLNFKRWKSNAKGVDINRNFDGDWGYIKLNPGKQSYQFYSGTKPLTTKEAKVLYDYTLRMDPEMVLSFHSAGQRIYWWFLQQGEQKKRDYVYAKALGKMTGYGLMPDQNDQTAGGTYTDWVRNRLKKPAFTVEVAKPIYQNNPPISSFDSEYKRTKATGLYIANESFKLWEKKNGHLYKEMKSVEEKFNVTIASYKTSPSEAVSLELAEIKERLLAEYAKLNLTIKAEETQIRYMSLGFYDSSDYARLSEIHTLAGNKIIHIYINDRPLTSNVIIQEGITYVPVRSLSEAIGADLSINGNNGGLTMNLNDVSLTMFPNNKTVILNGINQVVQVEAITKNGITYIPLRYLNEYFKIDFTLYSPSIIVLE